MNRNLPVVIDTTTRPSVFRLYVNLGATLSRRYPAIALMSERIKADIGFWEKQPLRFPPK